MPPDAWRNVCRIPALFMTIQTEIEFRKIMPFIGNGAEEKISVDNEEAYSDKELDAKVDNIKYKMQQDSVDSSVLKRILLTFFFALYFQIGTDL